MARDSDRDRRSNATRIVNPAVRTHHDDDDGADTAAETGSTDSDFGASAAAIASKPAATVASFLAVVLQSRSGRILAVAALVVLVMCVGSAVSAACQWFSAVTDTGSVARSSASSAAAAAAASAADVNVDVDVADSDEPARVRGVELSGSAVPRGSVWHAARGRGRGRGRPSGSSGSRPSEGDVDDRARLPTPPRSDAETFVIMSLPRSGSSYLQTMLDSHAEMLVFPEIFSGNYYDAIAPANSVRGAEAYVRMFVHDHRRLCKFGFCDPPTQNMFGQKHTGVPIHAGLNRHCATCSSDAADRARIVGFKVISTGPQLLLAHKALEGRKIIVLCRRAILMRVLSGIHMATAGVHRLEDPSTGYTSKQHAKWEESKLVPLEHMSTGHIVNQIASTLQHEQELLNAARARSDRVHVVWYEDLEAAEGNWHSPPWKDLFSFLGAPPLPLSTPLLKIHTNDTINTLYPELPQIQERLCAAHGRLREWIAKYRVDVARLGCSPPPPPPPPGAPAPAPA